MLGIYSYMQQLGENIVCREDHHLNMEVALDVGTEAEVEVEV